jgi:hypothetical protein
LDDKFERLLLERPKLSIKGFQLFITQVHDFPASLLK